MVVLKTTASVEIEDEFSARIVPGDGTIFVESDLTGLNHADHAGGQSGRAGAKNKILAIT